MAFIPIDLPQSAQTEAGMFMSDGNGTRANMSEPMTSGTTEDVLTSIRRLVSQDLRPAPMPPRSPAVTPTDGAPAAQIVSRIVVSDKLILTPALRVVSSREAKPAEAAPSADAPSLAASAATMLPPLAKPQGPLPRLHLEAAHSAALGAAAQAKTPDLVAALSQAVDQRAALDWESEAGENGDDTEALNWDNFVFVRRSMQDLWAARGSDSAATTPAAATPPAASSPATAAPQAEEAPALDAVTDAVTAAWADAAEAEVIAGLRDLGMPEAAEPLTKAEAAPARDPEVATAEVIPGVAQTEDDIFSEQVLRELVRDLIREELQGGLGERITRNIRKLVRAEIARSLAVQDLS